MNSKLYTESTVYETASKTIEMTERADWLAPWTATQCICTKFGNPSSVYSSRVSNRLFYEPGILERLSYLLMAKFSSFLLLCPSYLIWTAYF